METGWIKIHRKLLEWEWADDPNMVALWIHLLLNANLTDKKYRGKTIPRGSFKTSLNELVSKTGLSKRNLRTCLERLKSTHEVTQQTTHEYSIITICKFDTYQLIDNTTNTPNDTPNDTQATHQRHTSDTPNKEKSPTPPKESIEEGKNERTISKEKVEKETGIDFMELVDFFNETTQGVFGTIRPPLNATRKAMLKARIAEHGQETFEEVVRMAMESEFLKGQNNQGWRASFDWLIKPTNFDKVLSGNYANREKPTDHYKGDDTIGKNFVRRGFKD